MSRVNVRLARLFDPSDAGLYELPTEVTRLRQAIDRLHSVPPPDAPTPGDVMTRLTAETRAAALAGDDLPDAATVVEAEQRQAAETHRQRITRDVAEQLSETLIATVADLADTVITDHLRPVHDAAVAALADAAKVTEQYPAHSSALLAPPKVRATLADMPGTYERYIAVIAARAVVLGCNPTPQRDDTNILSGIRNAEELWPRRSRYATAKPWPDGLAGVLWLLRNGAELWLPTAAEQGQRYEEVFGELEREQQAHASNLQGYREMFTGSEYHQPASGRQSLRERFG